MGAGESQQKPPAAERPPQQGEWAPAHPPSQPIPTPRNFPPQRDIPGAFKVLLIACRYSGARQLPGSAQDIANATSALRRHGFRPSSGYKVVTDVQSARDLDLSGAVLASKEGIAEAFLWLTHGIRPGQSVFALYSGHGGEVRGERSAEDAIIPCNWDGTPGGVVSSADILAAAAFLPAGTKLTMLCDFCHGGSVLRLANRVPSGTAPPPKSPAGADALRATVVSIGRKGGPAGPGKLTTAFIRALDRSPAELTMGSLVSAMAAEGADAPEVTSTEKLNEETPFELGYAPRTPQAATAAAPAPAPAPAPAHAAAAPTEQPKTYIVRKAPNGGVGVSYAGEHPVWITGVVMKSPARRAGLRAGMRLLAVDGHLCGSATEAEDLFRTAPSDREFEVVAIAVDGAGSDAGGSDSESSAPGGDCLEFSFHDGSVPHRGEPPARRGSHGRRQRQGSAAESAITLGPNALTVQRAPGEILGMRFAAPGLRVHSLQPGGAADRAGAASYVGYQLTHVNDVPVRNPQEVANAVGTEEILHLRFSVRQDHSDWVPPLPPPRTVRRDGIAARKRRLRRRHAQQDTPQEEGDLLPLDATTSTNAAMAGTYATHPALEHYYDAGHHQYQPALAASGAVPAAPTAYASYPGAVPVAAGVHTSYPGGAYAAPEADDGRTDLVEYVTEEAPASAAAAAALVVPPPVPLYRAPGRGHRLPPQQHRGPLGPAPPAPADMATLNAAALSSHLRPASAPPANPLVMENLLRRLPEEVGDHSAEELRERVARLEARLAAAEAALQRAESRSPPLRQRPPPPPPIPPRRRSVGQGAHYGSAAVPPPAPPIPVAPRPAALPPALGAGRQQPVLASADSRLSPPRIPSRRGPQPQLAVSSRGLSPPRPPALRHSGAGRGMRMPPTIPTFM